MYSVDKTGYKQVLMNFHQQVEQSGKIFFDSKIQLDVKRIKNILCFGMGGSGIGGEMLGDVLFDTLKVPMQVVRGYLAPGYCSEETLLIAASYSGNTEETLSALKAAEDSGAQIIALTSGGDLAKQALAKHWNLIRIPGGLMPRQAIGYLFFPLYHLFGSLGLAKNYSADLKMFIKFLKNLAVHNDYPNKAEHVFSLDLARTIQNKIPVIYSSAPYLRTISKRWQNQIHENGTSLAFANVLPEMNHNEIVGWDLDSDGLKELIVIFLENENPQPRIQQRIELSKKIIKERGVQVVDIYSKGSTVLEKVFSLLIMGDWVSYYLALAYKKDPADIKNIDFLKQEMAKLKA